MESFGNLFIYADDLCLFYRYQDLKVSQTQIEYDAGLPIEFSLELDLNSTKTKLVRFIHYVLRNDENLVVHIGGTAISESEKVMYLGVELSRNLVWDEHIDSLKGKISSGIRKIYKFKNKLGSDAKLLTYQSLVHSHLTYVSAYDIHTYLPMINFRISNPLRTKL